MKNKSPHEKYLLGLKKNKIKIIVLQIAVLCVFVGIWQLAASLEWIDDFFFSSPMRIFEQLKVFLLEIILGHKIYYHIAITLTECILGFVISTMAGTFIAILLWWSKTARRVLEPYLVVLNSLPKIALGPIILVWIGAGMKSIVIMAVLICIIVTIISVLNGFLNCDQGKIRLMESMGASKLQILFKLILPYSVPNLLAVLKINVGLAWVGTIMGEYLVSNAGLGFLIIYGGQVLRMTLVMACIIILCVLAVLMYGVVAIAEKFLPRHR